MRIIAGQWRGRRIEAPPGELVRPTRDRIREAWMSIVHHALPDARVLDLCAGSGALGLEALSRGAAQVDFVEQSPRALTVLRANLDRLGGHPGAAIHRDDAVRWVEACAAGHYDVAFADPPYDSAVADALVRRWLEVPFAHLLGIEHAAGRSLPPGGTTRRYGTTALTFYRSPTT
jgi:16S rRNA (guanine966-N2)-methyltransferase